MSSDSFDEERQYLNLVRRIIDQGESRRRERTGVGTLSLFAPPSMEFDLSDGRIPLLTTKRVFWRGVVEELLWFLRGETDSSTLEKKGIYIWSQNTTREELDARGLIQYPEGECGPIYGYQWRRWNSPFHAGKGGDAPGEERDALDQLSDLVTNLIRDPEGRRHILTAWNPEQLHQMVLPPCHCFAQFYASSPDPSTGRRALSCQLYQRSADMGLGVPFNMASYSLLTCLLAEVCGMDRGRFIHTMGDAHIYCNHVEALEEQLTRHPRPFPTLHVRKGCLHQGQVSDLESLSIDDIQLEGYCPYPTIKMDMAA